ncbi:hypothetical protein [Domibacillus indicus]|uniref:hypothetical protein n=1 Tax=Domibacillus indicus TaxID=1437523 RepID=UPI0009E6045F|nr:hypothetical protein [Domibacillus indicus]
MKKKVFNAVMTGALSLGVLGAAGLPALAASTTALDSSTKAKVEAIMENLRTKLEEIGVDLPERGDRFANLDEETREKAEAIMEQKEAGEITEEKAKAQLEALGVTLPERGAGKGSGRLVQAVEQAGLDESIQAKADDILAQLEAGTITYEQAKEQLTALGIEISERGGKEGFLAGLDEETKAKAEAILERKKAGAITGEEAKAQLQGLGIELPEHGSGKSRHGSSGNLLEGLNEETKAEAEGLIEDARTQLEELGIDKMPLH